MAIFEQFEKMMNTQPKLDKLNMTQTYTETISPMDHISRSNDTFTKSIENFNFKKRGSNSATGRSKPLQSKE